MADTQTANYQWVKPEIAGSASTWGGKLNSDLDLIDAQVFTNQTAIDKLNSGVNTANALTLNKPVVANGNPITGQFNAQNRWQIQLGDGAAESGAGAGSNFSISRYSDAGALVDSPLTIVRGTGQVLVTQAPANPSQVATKAYVDAGAVPIGGIIMYTGSTPPPNYLGCNGGIYNATAAPALFNLLGSRFGGNGTSTFGVPNLNGRVVVGFDGGGYAPIGAVAGEASHQLSVAEMPGHAHPGSYDAGHAHGVNDPGHQHNVNLQGVNTAAGGLTPGGQAFGLGNQTALPAPTGISIQAAQANIQIAAQGSNAAHNNMQPYMVLWFCIRYQ